MAVHSSKAEPDTRLGCGTREKVRAEGQRKITLVPTNTPKKWTPEEDERLRSLIESSMSIPHVAAKLKRSVSAVKGRAHLLKISIKRASFELNAKGK